MNRKMQSGYWRFIKLSSLAGVWLGLLMVLAMPAWGNPAHVHKGVSPFEGKGLRIKSHCLLNGHVHRGLPCPHDLLNLPKNRPGFFINVECGGSRQGSLPLETSFDHNPGMTASSYFAALLNIRDARPGAALPWPFCLPNSLDHPPRSV